MRKIAALIIALTLLLVGCTPKSSGDLLDPKHPITITIWTYYNGAQLTSFNQLVDLFNATVGKEQGIIVESSSQGGVSDLERNVLDAAYGKIGASEVPSIFAAYADTAYEIDKMGLVADLRPYFTQEELDLYIDSYIEEGNFFDDGSLKIFPVAKSTELLLLNKTDWNEFSRATGASYEDFSTIEGLTKTAQAYYEWTDSLTPDIPNDGKAFYGRDAMANYFIVGAMQLGTEIFEVNDGVMTLNFDKDTIRKLWDNYYIPFVKGYFASSGKFRSDDVRTGNVICYTGSSSSATFFPDFVTTSDTEGHSVEMEAFVNPAFEGAKNYAVQQGAGMAVTVSDEAHVYASVVFLKWFTDSEQNIEFSIGSGYMPVQRSANNIDILLDKIGNSTVSMKRILTAATKTVKNNELYTPKAFSKGGTARDILEYSMSDRAWDDRLEVEKRLKEGVSYEDAIADFISEENFEKWYNETLNKLKNCEG